MGILDEVKKRRVFFDGGTGTLLQAEGLLPGEQPETWNLIHPDRIRNLHLQYLNAGCDIVTTDTFGLNRFKFKKEDGYDVARIAEAAVNNAKAAVSEAGHGYVAIDMGPTGQLLKPYGTLDFEDAVNAYKEVASAGEAAGADLVIIETMGDSYELKAAVLAAKESTSLPVFATVTLDEKGKMLTGGNVETVTALLEGLGADVIGLNCGLGPVQLLPFLKRMYEAASVPVMVNPNAGLPRSEGGNTVYDIDSDMFASAMKDMAKSGASVLGGCCGTTPEHIRKTIELCKDIPLPEITDRGYTVVSSYSHVLDLGKRPVVVGERINPTGKPRLKKALQGNDLTYVLEVGVSEQEAGADALDVNVGLPGIDEPLMMENTVKELQSVVDLPLQIDTSDIGAMERALRVYNGKALINSVNGKKEVMDAVFPIAKKYGGVIIALCLDEEGIPDTADGRIEVAKKIIETAASYGIDKKNIIVDSLCMAVSSDKNGAIVTLETVRRVHDELGVKTILGVSNISFGLPMRENINCAFFTVALQNGLSAAIINPNSERMMAAFDSYLVLSAQDENCERYISIYGKKEAETKKKAETGKAADIPETAQYGMSPVRKSIIKGMVESAKEAAETALAYTDPMALINEEMIPALDEVGRGFEEGTIFIPQLLMSADAAKASFAVVQERMAAEGNAQEKRGKVILATVKGDIHDIGKNIVKVLLESYSFDVIDLGRDVAPETIVEAAVAEHIPVVGLSALMTTTVPSMEETIKQLREKAPWVKIMVGGAVLTKEYAESIGADAYCKDAMASVDFSISVIESLKE